jgi:subfamily B ATP-binding cassette protein MsbA
VGAKPDRPLRLVTRLLVYARPYVWLVGVAILFSLLYGGGLTGRAALIGPVLDGIAVPSAQLGSVVDLFDYEGESDAALHDAETRRMVENIRANTFKLIIAGLMLILGMPLVRFVRDYSGRWLMTRVLVDLQSDLATKLLRLPLGHHERRASGDFVARITKDTGIANRVQSLVFGDAVQDAAILLAALTGAFFINWRLALVVLLVGPPIAVTLQVFGRRIRKRSEKRQLQVSEVMQRMMQILDGIKVIKAFSAEGQEANAFQRTIMRFFRRSMSVIRSRVYSRVAVEMISQLSLVSLLFVGVWALTNRMWGLSVGQLSAFIFVSALTYRPMKALTGFYNTVMNALPSAERIFALLDAPEEEEDRADALHVERVAEGIRYRDVWFSYGRERVLEGVDLRIEAGEVLALVGHTGVGKSTIADLLLRFYDPERGAVEIDGVDLRHLRRRSLRQLMAVVTQEAFLFDTTILENIRYGRPEATLEEVVEAARTANAHEFIESLPEGYDTPVGERGTHLSGGQRQRLTIARAILCDPQILIFDEATSALDSKAERLVQEAIGNLMKGRTVLVIAHRLATVRSADHIAVIDGGRVETLGTHDELLERSPLYRELVELQSFEPSASA